MTAETRHGRRGRRYREEEGLERESQSAASCAGFNVQLNGEVPKEGLEPSRHCWRLILSQLRLPFRHFGSTLVSNTVPFLLQASSWICWLVDRPIIFSAGISNTSPIDAPETM